jgi:hypothetical protein
MAKAQHAAAYQSQKNSEIPGAENPGQPDGDAADPALRIAELEASLAAAQQAAIEANARATEAASKAALPQVVFEPATPHGSKALAASETGHMTMAEVMAAIDAGQLDEPTNAYLCSDGYYARRS